MPRSSQTRRRRTAKKRKPRAPATRGCREALRAFVALSPARFLALWSSGRCKGGSDVGLTGVSLAESSAETSPTTPVRAVEPVSGREVNGLTDAERSQIVRRVVETRLRR